MFAWTIENIYSPKCALAKFRENWHNARYVGFYWRQQINDLQASCVHFTFRQYRFWRWIWSSNHGIFRETYWFHSRPFESFIWWAEERITLQIDTRHSIVSIWKCVEVVSKRMIDVTYSPVAYCIQLYSTWLLYQFLTPRIPVSSFAARKARDSISKAIYSRLFEVILSSINGISVYNFGLTTSIVDIAGFGKSNFVNESLRFSII